LNFLSLPLLSQYDATTTLTNKITALKLKKKITITKALYEDKFIAHKTGFIKNPQRKEGVRKENFCNPRIIQYRFTEHW